MTDEPRELLEDEDGAPLPDELQRDGAMWRAIRDAAMLQPNGTVADEIADTACVELAPILWPLLDAHVTIRDLTGRTVARISLRGSATVIADTPADPPGAAPVISRRTITATQDQTITGPGPAQHLRPGDTYIETITAEPPTGHPDHGHRGD